MAKLRIYDLLFISFAYIFTGVTADTCVKQSACVCIFPNGTGIDLNPSASVTFSSVKTYRYSVPLAGPQYTISTYYYHPCSDIKLPDFYNGTIPPSNNTCTEALSICRYVNTMTKADKTPDSLFKLDTGALDKMALSTASTFSDKGDAIIYGNLPSQTTVLLRCAQTEDQLQVYSEDDPQNIVLAFYSKDACLKQIQESGRSTGSTLLIIFFSFVIFYLVLGICTKKFLMGATGIEVIPNLGFWSELPNLVRDGWLFMINGFKLPARASGQTVSPDPNSYDSI